MSNDSKNTCPVCHGKGKITCRSCNGKGRRKCPSCHGTGHACPVCCNTGYLGERPGYKKDKYGDWDYCPNCHGDYTNAKYVCKHCGGTGVASCSKTEWCPQCDGKGTLDEEKLAKYKRRLNENKVSKQDRRIFRALVMIGGLLGLHYAYIRRWERFAIQLALTITCSAFLFAEEMVSRILGIAGHRLEVSRNLLLLGMSIYLILSFRTERDGDYCKLQEGEFKSGRYWLLALFFGITGAHLLYAGSFILLCISMFFSTGILAYARQDVIAAIKAFPSLDPEISYRGFLIPISIALGTALLGWWRGLSSRKEKKS